mgnify:CR=1 FL=1
MQARLVGHAVAEEKAASFSVVPDGLESSQAGFERTGEGVGEEHEVGVSRELRMLLRQLLPQVSELSDGIGAFGGTDVNGPAVPFKQFDGPAFADQVQLVPLLFQQIQGGQGEHSFTHPITESDEQGAAHRGRRPIGWRRLHWRDFASMPRSKFSQQPLAPILTHDGNPCRLGLMDL